MSIGSVSSTPRFSGHLRSINLRPIAQGQGPQSSQEGADRATGQSSSPSESSTSQPAVSGDGTRRSGTGGSGSPPSSSPQRRVSLIGGESRPSSTPGEERGSGSSSETDGPVSGNAQASGPADSEELSPSERRKVQELKRIDAKVRAHEQAHLAAAGQYAQGGISLETTAGPDGKEYAVAGEVSLDTSEAESPRKTVQKMRQVKSAALAPAQPSPQDRAVASQASKKLSEAQKELRSQESEGSGTSTSTPENSGSPEVPSGPEGPDDFGAASSDSNREGQAVAASGVSTDSRDPGNPVSQFVTGADNSSRQPGQRLNLLA